MYQFPKINVTIIILQIFINNKIIILSLNKYPWSQVILGKIGEKSQNAISYRKMFTNECRRTKEKC